ncbi:MAG: hypothetical protein QHJ73_20155, partial [Armatimonadota bacterium]|nr:hypothetical protein [Armatimonadota bacterium]
MEVLTGLDGGVVHSFEVADDCITFDLRPGQQALNVLLRGAPDRLRVRVRLDKNGASILVGQGLLWSTDGETFALAPLTPVSDGVWEAAVFPRAGEVRVVNRFPYGRDGLDQLLCDTGKAPGGEWRMLRRGHRCVPLFQFGADDGRKRVHYFIAGEDAWETAGSLVADAMVRHLATDALLARRVEASGL